MLINQIPLVPFKSTVSNALSEWVNHQESLTDKLHVITGSVQLEVLSQSWIKPTWWDCYLLQIKNKPTFQREILMKSNGTNYWYARVVIPQCCYNLDKDFFSRLKHESIKNLIFGNEEVSRVAVAAYPIDKQCTEFYWVNKYLNLDTDLLWVRYAEYSYRQGASFYVIEILLPELENLSR